MMDSRNLQIVDGKEIKQHDLTLEDIVKIQNSTDMIFIPESDYGLGEIYHTDGKFQLYSIPMYGGEPRLELVDSNAQIILSSLQSWS